MKHTPTVIPATEGKWVGSCTCNWRAPDVCSTSQEAEESNLRHLRDVERVRANSRSTQPSLREMRDYYLSKAAEQNGDTATADLWQRLADEITHRLNDGGPVNDGQSALF